MNNTFYIFTDGACPNNGKKSARAAYSVVLWNLPGSSEPIGIADYVPVKEVQTNQRAELRGLYRAFEEIRTRELKGIVVIYTDSEYAIKCITEWGPCWKAYGYKRKQNPSKPIEHIDILKPMIEYYEESQHFIKIKHIRAHTGKKEFPYCGNEMADTLATELVNKH